MADHSGPAPTGYHHQLIPAAFDATENRWRPASNPAGPVTADRLTLATYNIWFGDYHFERRIHSVLEILASLNADLIALQEVTAPSLGIILAQPWVRERYRVSDARGNTFLDYGVILLSRIPPLRMARHAFPSVMGRYLLAADFEINGAPLRVATTHLESLRHSAETRSAQLNLSFQLLKQAPHAVMMGDFNFCASWKENHAIDPAYRDLWPALRGSEPGYTEDTDINRMRRQLKREEKKVRFDRILLKSGVPGWRPSAIRRLGMDPVSPDTPDLFPSDHFGLAGTIEWVSD